MNDDGRAKAGQVAALVLRQITDGSLRPGRPVPAAAALSRQTGASLYACRKALAALTRDGALVPGPTPGARLRVHGPPAPGSAAEAAGALSGALAAARHAAGLSQQAAALRIGCSVTAVSHAETGRLWQARTFWEAADSALAAPGALTALHDAYRDASAAGKSEARLTGAAFSELPVPWSIFVVWSDGTLTSVSPVTNCLELIEMLAGAGNPPAWRLA